MPPQLSSSTQARLDSLLSEFTSGDSPRLPGSFIGITSLDDTPLYLKAAGRRNISEPQDARGPVNPETRMFIASCTKSIVAIAVLLLIQDGKLKSLDQSVDEWIPEMKANGVLDPKTGNISPVEKDITLRMLLNHTNGSAYPFKDPDFFAWAMAKEIPSAFSLTKEAFISLPLLHQPGDDWTYGFGLDWAVLLINRLLASERGSEEYSFSHFFHERIAGPLGMKHSSFSPESLCGPDDTSMYLSKDGMDIHWREQDGSLVPLTTQFQKPAGGVFKGEGAASANIESGGAGLVSTITDYTKYLRYLLRLSERPSSSDASDLVKSGLYISLELVKELFEDTLEDRHIQSLAQTLSVEGVVDPQDGYENIAYTAGLSVLKGPSKQGLPTGTVFWSGITCLFYFIDPTKKVAMMVATQVLMYGDPAWKELLHKATQVVYDGLDS